MNFRYIILFFAFLLFSCEEVIDLDLDTAEPKLVIEASLNKNDNGSTAAFVKITQTTGFTDTIIPVVPNASVRVIDETGTIYPFLHIENGVYTTENLSVEPETTYTLEVNYENELFTATARLVPVVPFDGFVEQINDGGFDGEEIELKAFFTDPGGVENFYFFVGLSAKGNVYDALKDDFFDGNQIFGFYTVEDLEPGDEISFNLYGIDSQAYDYLFNLLLQTEAPAGPFETQPATVRGNIVNTTNPDNFPLGYFRISEVSRLSYTVE
mgnify:CR=1 FL=1|tara:strand:+ start:2349 stop:3152 length:804 start_codon:yes stop_codon:yes gene_type:complete